MTISFFSGSPIQISVVSCPGATALRVIFAVLGKFCINASFSTIYVFSTELLPTVIRLVRDFFRL